jgi:hypothetical protein
MPGRRNPLFPWSPVVIDALWQSGILQRVLWPDGNTQALNAEGVGGYRAIFILLTAKAALREHRPEVAAELFSTRRWRLPFSVWKRKSGRGG